MYVPLAQVQDEGWSNTLALAIATTEANAQRVISAARHEVLAVDPTQPISQVFTTNELLERRLVRPRFNVQRMTAVAILAIACVSLGIFGVFAYIARLRRNEFAVRLALGASPAQLAGVVLNEALRLAIAGLAVGVLAMIALVPLFRSELYGVASLDVSVVAAATTVIGVVTLLSLVVPARFAARTDATASLR